MNDDTHDQGAPTRLARSGVEHPQPALAADGRQVEDEIATADEDGLDQAARRALEAMDTADMRVALELDIAKDAVQKRPSPS